MDEEKRFIFRGNAVGFAGHLRRPEDAILWAQAPCCLPVTGGYCRADAGPYNFRDMVTFGAASTIAVGDFIDRTAAAAFTNGNHGKNNLPTRTEVNATVRVISVTVRGPNSSRTLRCRALISTLVSQSDRRSEISIKPVVAVFEGLELDGCALTVTTSDVFSRLDTKTAVSAAYEKDDFFKEYGRLIAAPGGVSTQASGKRRIPESAGTIHGTVVEKIEWNGPPVEGCSIEGNRITMAEFGSIYLGELIMSDSARRLTMMRLQLGSPDGGEMTFAETESNGHTWPP